MQSSSWAQWTAWKKITPKQIRKETKARTSPSTVAALRTKATQWAPLQKKEQSEFLYNTFGTVGEVMNITQLGWMSHVSVDVSSSKVPWGLQTSLRYTMEIWFSLSPSHFHKWTVMHRYLLQSNCNLILASNWINTFSQAVEHFIFLVIERFPFSNFLSRFKSQLKNQILSYFIQWVWGGADTLKAESGWWSIDPPSYK